MTKVKVDLFKPVRVVTDGYAVVLNVPEKETTLYPGEARKLIKALKKHIKKAEGK